MLSHLCTRVFSIRYSVSCTFYRVSFILHLFLLTRRTYINSEDISFLQEEHISVLESTVIPFYKGLFLAIVDCAPTDNVISKNPTTSIYFGINPNLPIEPLYNIDNVV